jgi:hypothetical protein
LWKLARPFDALFHLGKRHSTLLELKEFKEVRIKLKPGLELSNDAELKEDLLGDIRLSDFNANRATPDHLIAPIVAIGAQTPVPKVFAEARPFPPPLPFADEHWLAFVRPVPFFGPRRDNNCCRRNQPFAGPRACHAGPRKNWEIGFGTQRIQVPNQVLWTTLDAIFLIVAGAVTSNNNGNRLVLNK